MQAKRFSLFAFLITNSEIRDWAVAQNRKLELAVQVERQRELVENQERFERFE
jgi:hypothetical protein